MSLSTPASCAYRGTFTTALLTLQVSVFAFAGFIDGISANADRSAIWKPSRFPFRHHLVLTVQSPLGL
jgi:hypothetical protein